MEWISVSSALPEANERVLLFTPFDIFGDDHVCVGSREAILTCSRSQAERTIPLFSHWLALPELPSPSSLPPL